MSYDKFNIVRKYLCKT